MDIRTDDSICFDVRKCQMMPFIIIKPIFMVHEMENHRPFAGITGVTAA